MHGSVQKRFFSILAVGALIAAGCGGSSSSSSNTSSSSSSGTTSTSSSSGGTSTTASAGGNAAQGKQLFESNGCSGCHTLKAAGSSGTTGPNLDTALASDAKAAGKPLAAFVKESIVKPSAYIAKGYSDGIMPSSFGQSLKPAQVDALVAFVTGK